jgi:hypothetical protein
LHACPKRSQHKLVLDWDIFDPPVVGGNGEGSPVGVKKCRPSER